MIGEVGEFGIAYISWGKWRAGSEVNAGKENDSDHQFVKHGSFGCKEKSLKLTVIGEGENKGGMGGLFPFLESVRVVPSCDRWIAVRISCPVPRSLRRYGRERLRN